LSLANITSLCYNKKVHGGNSVPIVVLGLPVHKTLPVWLAVPFFIVCGQRACEKEL
jgi:hypothetical protein